VTKKITRFNGFGFVSVVLFLFIIIAIAAVLAKSSRPPPTITPINNISPTIQETNVTKLHSAPREKIKVTYVVDGDTIVLESGKKVRYIGIDTPEMGENGKPDDCFAQTAKSVNTSLVLNQVVELEKDTSDTDKYGRLLRYVYVDGVLINDFLVRQGYARLETVPPDTGFASELKSAEQEAKINKRGLWKECGI
jgi:endonuclease YncB( thermonuclease family)